MHALSNRLFAAAGDWRGGAALIALCCLLYVPGFLTIPPVDRDEPRFAQASRQMLHSGSLDGWVVPRVQDVPRLKKPPLIYWLQAAAGAIAGDNPSATDTRTAGIWAFRLPSLFAAIAAVLLTWRIGVSMFHPIAAWLAGAILAGGWLIITDAHLARADQLLLACTCLTQYALWHIWKSSHRQGDRAHRAMPILFWIAIALGILAKGPITPAIAAMTAISLGVATRSWRWMFALRPGIGVVVCIGMVAPWCVLVSQALGWHALLDAINDEVINRSSTAQEGHFGPPGYHALLMPILLWPGSLLAVAAIPRAWRAARGGRRAELFLLAWLIPAWMVFELIMTKLPHYTMPLYPALALLSGRAVCAAASGALRLPSNFGVRFGIGLWLAIGIAFVAVGPLALLYLSRESLSISTLVLAVPLLLAGIFALVLAASALRLRRWLVAQIWGIVAGVASAGLIFGVLLPASEPLWLPSRVIAELKRLDPADERPLACCGYFEDSLVFLTRGRIQRIKPDALADWQRDNPAGIMIVDAALVGNGSSGRLLSGLNYSAGRQQQLAILTPAAPTH